MIKNKQLLIATIIFILFFVWILRDKSYHGIPENNSVMENCYSDYMGGVQCD